MNDSVFLLPRDVLELGTKRPLLSWRAKLLVDVIPTPYRLDESKDWTAKANKRIAFLGEYRVSDNADGPPNVWAVVGTNTAYAQVDRGGSLQAVQPTVLLVETDLGKGHWMEPGDLPLDVIIGAQDKPMSTLLGVPSCAEAFHVMFSNGEIIRLRSSIPANEFVKLCHTEIAKTVDREQVIDFFRLNAR